MSLMGTNDSGYDGDFIKRPNAELILLKSEILCARVMTVYDCLLMYKIILDRFFRLKEGSA